MKHLFMLIALTAALTVEAAHSQKYYVWKSSSDKAFLGVNSDGISESKAKLLGANNYHGNYVTKVLKNYAAEKAGIRPFDYIYGIDDLRASNGMDLSTMLSKYKAGDKAVVHFFRKGKPLSAEVTFEKRREYESETEWDWNDKAFLGVSSLEEDEDEATAGVKVEIVSNSTAESIGLRDEDIIHSINGYKMIDWSDISTAISTLKPGEKIDIEYERAGKKSKVEGTVQSQAERMKRLEVQKAEPASYAFLGIHSNGMDEDKAKKLGFETPYGSYVSYIVKGSAAEKAGLRAFDYVYGIDDYRVSENKPLTTLLKKYKAGEKATVHFIRNGKKESVAINFGKRGDAQDAMKEDDKCQAPFLGVNETESYEAEGKGVAIAPIKKSTAEAMGLQKGDVILKINGIRILDWTDLGVAVDICKVGENISVVYLREGKEMTAATAMKSYCDTKPYTEWGWNDGEVHIFSADETEEPARARQEATGAMGRPEALDLSKVKVTVEDPTQQETQEMKTRYNLDVTPASDLRVNELGLFPNPDNGSFKLQFELPEQGTTNIRIYNAAGRSIYDYELGTFSGPFSDEVDISQNGPGAYFLEITQGGKRFTKKVVLQKVMN